MRFIREPKWPVIRRRSLVILLGLLCVASLSVGDEPPELNPFARRSTVPEDARRGVIRLSNGETRAGQIYLTRDTRLKVYDEAEQREREIPLRVIQRIDGSAQKEWREKEWRFKENANNTKVYTGKSYPARLYLHTVTLQGGKKITGALSAVVYVLGEQRRDPEKFVLYKRQHGEVGQSLDSLVYVRSIELDPSATK